MTIMLFITQYYVMISLLNDKIICKQNKLSKQSYFHPRPKLIHVHSLKVLYIKLPNWYGVTNTALDLIKSELKNKNQVFIFC